MAPDRQVDSGGGDGQTRLLVPLEMARAELEKLVADGRELKSRADAKEWRSPQVAAPWEFWSRDTRRLLRNWFSNDEVAIGFVEAGHGQGRDPEAFEVGLHLYFQLAFLESLLRRLDSFAILPASHPIDDISPSVPERSQAPGPSYITYNIRGSVGQLFTGEVQTVKNIKSHIAAVMGQGEPRVGTAFQQLVEVTLIDPKLDQHTRAEVLETIEYLAEAAEAEPAERKPGRITSIRVR